MIEYWILRLDVEIALSSSQKMENKFVIKLYTIQPVALIFTVKY